MLGACGTSGFRAEVKRFHQLPPPAEETLQIVPAANLDAGIEFNSYAEQVGERLGALGYRSALEGAPDLVVTLDYRARPDPSYRPAAGPMVGFGIGGYGSHVGGGLSTAVDLSDSDRIYHLHTVSLVIAEADGGNRLYEGSAGGYALGSQLPQVMPLLIEALFRDWPGASGTSNTVKLDNQ